MKKALSVLLVILIVFSLCSCGKSYSHKMGNDAVAVVQEMKKIKSDLKSDCSATKYTMDMMLDVIDDVVEGTVKVDIVNNSEKPLKVLCFRLYSAEISGSEITYAENAKTKKEYTLSTKNLPSVYYIILGDDEVEAGGKISVTLEFKTIVPRNNDRFGYYECDKGKLYNLSFCFPQLAFLEDGVWFEEPYNGYGENLINEMSDYYVKFKAPKNYKIVSSGKIISDRSQTIIEAKNVREFALTACSFAKIKTTESGGITYNIMMPMYEEAKEKYLTEYYNVLLTTAMESVEIFSKTFGEYIYDELDIVPVFYDGAIGGMEYPGLIQVSMPWSDGSQPAKESMSCDSSVVTTCHEVGHQWFYCAVGNNEATEPWLDEGFTSYLEKYFFTKAKKTIKAGDKFNKKYSDNEGLLYTSSFVEDAVSKDYINFPADDYEMEDYGTLVYENGSEFLRALENTMGEKAFIKMLSKWYKANTNQIVTGAEFIKFVLKHDSSEEVVEIINDYISDEAI
ncbi:MAG: M1 family metallopeptidase [Clostridia bacterium]|nr:M1 family metallopeptidase [Clostridia bacterium]